MKCLGGLTDNLDVCGDCFFRGVRMQGSLFADKPFMGERWSQEEEEQGEEEQQE